MLTEFLEDTSSQTRQRNNCYRVPVEIQSEGTAFASQPVQFGVCLPEGMFTSGIEGDLQLIESDSAIPVQIQPTVRHPDGSHQWVLIDALLPGSAKYSNGVYVVLQETDSDYEPELGQHSESFTIDHQNQPLRLSLQRGKLCLEELASNSPIFRHPGIGFELLNEKSEPLQPLWESIRQETAGTVRNTYQVKGVIGKRQSPLNLEARLSFYQQTGLIKVEICLHNPRRAKHAGGLWDLGDSGSELFEDFSIRIPHQFAGQSLKSWFVDEHNSDEVTESRRLHLYQDSSGGENWESRTHVNREGVVPSRFQGYQLGIDGKQISGDRATPVFAIGNDYRALSIAVPEFWQQFPKCLEVDDSHIRIGLFPKEWDDLHELQGGERKTSTFWLNLASGPAAIVYAVQDIQAVLSPVAITPSPEEYSEHGQIHDGTDIVTEDRASLDRLLAIALEGERGVFAKREAVDEYGWRNYGELVADHEAAYYEGPLPLVSHYNNQFDPIYGFLLNYLRTGNRKLYDLGDALARHVVDIDIYHTTQDKWGYNGGLFWHTDHYRDAHTSTHRSYSNFNFPEQGDYGGGPCNEHNYTTGLLLHYCLTGRIESREAVLGLADWVLQMDDGERSMFRYVASGPTGLASATREETFHGPGRGAGNSLNALLDAWQLTQDEKYLNYCEVLIRRCIHPQDDINQHQLLNAEERWSYTVFLTSLLKYLKCKVRGKQLDENYHYARMSLAHYTEWMALHERPYLDDQHQLEYPTETWPAQDLRKANVLRHASVYLDDPLRSQSFELGKRIAQRAWNDLWSFETTACARPLSILMVEGLKELATPPKHDYVTDATIEDYEFPNTGRFVGQKTKVKRIVKKPWLLLKEIVPE